LAPGLIQLAGWRRQTIDALGYIELSVEFLSECGWQLSDWDRWLVSHRLVPVVRSLKQRRPPDVRVLDALFDQLAMVYERYDLEDLEAAMRHLLAARALIEPQRPAREEEA
jgi:predicted TPR repeat methyltransferase